MNKDRIIPLHCFNQSDFTSFTSVITFLNIMIIAAMDLNLKQTKEIEKVIEELSAKLEAKRCDLKYLNNEHDRLIKLLEELDEFSTEQKKKKK